MEPSKRLSFFGGGDSSSNGNNNDASKKLFQWKFKVPVPDISLGDGRYAHSTQRTRGEPSNLLTGVTGGIRGGKSKKRKKKQV